MKEFVVKLESGEYLYNLRIGTGYMKFDRTKDPAAADALTDFDSKLAIRRLISMGIKNASREDARAK